MYLVFLLFGERMVCSPYKKFDYSAPNNISSLDKGFTRGYYQYTISYESLDLDTISALRKLEIDWGKNFGFFGSFDIPYTTYNRANDVDESVYQSPDRKFFLGTDALGITPEIFNKILV